MEHVVARFGGSGPTLQATSDDGVNANNNDVNDADDDNDNDANDADDDNDNDANEVDDANDDADVVDDDGDDDDDDDDEQDNGNHIPRMGNTGDVEALRDELASTKQEFERLSKEHGRTIATLARTRADAEAVKRLFMEYVEAGDDHARRFKCMAKIVTCLP
jgi:hypothetical protein